MKKIAIQTLTYNNSSRVRSLYLTFKTFYGNYYGPILDWYIVLNGYNKDIIDLIEEQINTLNDKFNIKYFVNEQNLGVGPGLNKLNNLCKDYEYTFLLEDDWICLPHYMSGHTENWFWNSVKLLDEYKEIDNIHFRRYLDDLDDRQYGYCYWLRPENLKEQIFNGDEYFIFNRREYTNNPSMRRMESFYNKGILPLKEFWDGDMSLEIKGNDYWGQAEIIAMKNDDIVTSWLYLGNFVHHENWIYDDNFDEWKKSNFGCGVNDMKGWNTCKYGYLFPGHYFCGVCVKNQTIHDLDIHSNLYLQEILPLEHSLVDNQNILDKINSLIENPTIDASKYINPDIYLNNGYYRGKK
jgi:hypothetical protein